MNLPKYKQYYLDKFYTLPIKKKTGNTLSSFLEISETKTGSGTAFYIKIVLLPQLFISYGVFSQQNKDSQNYRIHINILLSY